MSFFDEIANVERIISPNVRMVKMTVVGDITVEEWQIEFSVVLRTKDTKVDAEYWRQN